ncbi:putative PRKR-interacting protein 1-like [Apostichopus japonicus]|uniref:Putative PRKR-interacting protein 1-like n=1 Tax=Stichopus japonicus TaxID=307972 RepID=A0A2G8KSB3_STIJA|nr:putative PRKR-interacting protein 1-like [Apostichopus japonicus]
MAADHENGKQTENKKHFHKKNDKPLVLPKSFADKQRVHLEKLMNNMEKPVFIPEKLKNRTPRAPPEFVRDVMGSSAGAGSGEFHVYRGYRRREMARQAFLDSSHEKEEKDAKFQEKLEKNKQKAEDRTAKKRAKRQRRKQKQLAKKQKMQKEEEGEQKDSESSDSVDDNDDGVKEEKDDDAEANCFVIGGK